MKRAISYTLIFAILFALGIGIGYVLAQEAVVITRGGGWKAEWDAVTTNSDGTPCTNLQQYNVAISHDDVDIRTGGAIERQVEVTSPEFELATVEDLANDTYAIWVNAQDTEGEVSPWYGPRLFQLTDPAPEPDGVTPAMPRNMRFVRTVTRTETTTTTDVVLGE